jgi:hypothetical protein
MSFDESSEESPAAGGPANPQVTTFWRIFRRIAATGSPSFPAAVAPNLAKNRRNEETR